MTFSTILLWVHRLLTLPSLRSDQFYPFFPGMFTKATILEKIYAPWERECVKKGSCLFVYPLTLIHMASNVISSGNSLRLPKTVAGSVHHQCYIHVETVIYVLTTCKLTTRSFSCPLCEGMFSLSKCRTLTLCKILHVPSHYECSSTLWAYTFRGKYDILFLADA